jgi:hypothetical protein
MLLFVALTGAITHVHAADAGPHEVQRGEFSFYTGPAPGWVEPMAVSAEWTPESASGSADTWRHWLLDDQSYRVKAGRSRYRDYAYEPASAETLTDAGKFEINFVPEFQKLTVHELALRRDGEWQNRLNLDRITLARRESEFEQDMSTGAVSALLLLDDVRVGDIVRVRYTIEGENPILSGLDMDGAGFATAHPILDRQFRILFDRDAEPQEFRDARIAPAKILKTPGYLEWRYRAHGIAGQHDEGGYPNWFVAYPYVTVSEKRSWADIAQWAKRLYPEPEPLPEDLKQKIAQWQKLPTVDARIAAALLVVQEDVRYFGTEIGENTHRPAEPAQVWTQRRGDCKDKSRLLVAILDAMDIEAYPALVSSGNGKAIADHPPAASNFDHVIVQVRDGENTLWLDPTRTQQRGSARAQSVSEFGVALPVTADTRALVPVAPNPGYVDSSSVRERFDIADDGKSATLSVTSSYLGGAANRMRLELAVNGAEAISRRYEEVYRRRFGDLALIDPLQVKDDTAGNRVELVEHYTLTHPWGHSTAAERRLDLYADAIAETVRLPQTMSRTTPLGLSYPQQNQHRIELRLPAGWRWKGSPADYTRKDESVDYSYVAGQKKDVVFLEQNISTRAAVVPIAQMAEHLKLRREISDIAHPNWVLVLPELEAGKRRDQRLNALIRDVMKENDARNKDKDR